jgi:hypothetical protein
VLAVAVAVACCSHAIVGSSKVHMSNFSTALSWLGVDAGLDEVECILAHQVVAGNIKCYLSHDQQTAVFAGTQPFPTKRRK